MINNNEQGKANKVGATQERITAQNSANQGNEIFYAISEEKLEHVLSHYDFGIVKPSYIIANLKMAQRVIDKARMPEDQKGVLRNGYGFLLSALAESYKNSQYGPWEHVAEYYYPDDLADAIAEAEDDDEVQELLEQGAQEVGYIVGDFINDEGQFIEGSWEEAREVIEEYLDILNEHGYEVPECIFRDMEEIEARW